MQVMTNMQSTIGGLHGTLPVLLSCAWKGRRDESRHGAARVLFCLSVPPVKFKEGTDVLMDVGISPSQPDRDRERERESGRCGGRETELTSERLREWRGREKDRGRERDGGTDRQTFSLMQKRKCWVPKPQRTVRCLNQAVGSMNSKLVHLK